MSSGVSGKRPRRSFLEFSVTLQSSLNTYSHDSRSIPAILNRKIAKHSPDTRKCAAFHSRRESITDESPTSFPEEGTTIPYSGFEHEPTRLQDEGHNHHTGFVANS
ncbi:hypothetical protein TNCV_3682771 [Trichonephila clavipes]|uniref:Uncharacterized protein n=1 Tax=Trichonephila clavipes TaxID=2585209 RepID=A0A8X6RAU8_TRICX|nr:hypothetical protein TNCV_3682771 [Trichonephila clavipes]